jgi:hypothetical protein
MWKTLGLWIAKVLTKAAAEKLAEGIAKKNADVP